MGGLGKVLFGFVLGAMATGWVIYNYLPYSLDVQIGNANAANSVQVTIPNAKEAEAEANKDFNGVPVKVQTSQSFPAGLVKNVKIEVVRSLKVQMSSTTSDQVMLTLMGEGTDHLREGKDLKDWFRVKVSNGTLMVQSYEKKKSYSVNSLKDLGKMFNKDEGPRLTLVLEIPEKQKINKLNLEGVNLDFVASQISFNKLDVETVFGDLKITDCQGEEIEIEQVSGDSTLNIAGLKRVDIETVSSDVNLTSLKTQPEIKFESVSGDLQVSLPKDSQIDVNFESLTGELVNEFGTSQSAPRRVEFSSLSGDATITRAQ